MMTIVNDPNGRRRIMFIDRDHARRAVSIGKMSKSRADTFKTKVEHLVTAKITGRPLDGETARWVAGLGDEIHDRLAAVGLVPRRQRQQLGPWLEKYVASRTDLKPGSARKLGQTTAKLLAPFDPKAPPFGRSPRTTRRTGDGGLGVQGLSVAAVKIHSGNAKTIFAQAEEDKLIEELPFRELVSGSTAAVNDRYVTPTEAGAIIDALSSTPCRTPNGNYCSGWPATPACASRPSRTY
jgi:hypothetical protein